MESAPLTEAHSHVVKAATLAHQSDLAGAREHHRLAAESFQKAREGTRDPEATRILMLLEKQHEVLSQEPKKSPSTTNLAESRPSKGESTAQENGGKPRADLAHSIHSQIGKSSTRGVVDSVMLHHSQNPDPSRIGSSMGSNKASSGSQDPQEDAAAVQREERRRLFNAFYKDMNDTDLPAPLLAPLFFAGGGKSSTEKMNLQALSTSTRGAIERYSRQTPRVKDPVVFLPQSASVQHYPAGSIRRNNNSRWSPSRKLPGIQESPVTASHPEAGMDRQALEAKMRQQISQLGSLSGKEDPSSSVSHQLAKNIHTHVQRMEEQRDSDQTVIAQLREELSRITQDRDKLLEWRIRLNKKLREAKKTADGEQKG